jgi:hypothetical protein
VLGRASALVLFIAWSLPSPAGADWIFSPYIGARFAGNTNLLVGREGTEANKFTFGSSIGILTDGVLGAEVDVAFVPGFFSPDRSSEVSSPVQSSPTTSSLVTTLMGNVIVTTPLDLAQYGLRPYLVGGFGLMRARSDQGEGGLDLINSNLFALDIGAGAIGPLSPRSSVRFDLRYFHNVSDDAEAATATPGRVALSFWRATVGLTFRF